jgi:DNA-binding NarL/FixJ family response regulator
VARRQISIFAIEAEPVQAEGLRVLLAGYSEFEFTGACADPLFALERIARERPDLVIVDGDATPEDAFELVAAVQQVSLQSRSVLWVRELTELDAERAVDAGAGGAVRKTQPPEYLIECLRAVSRGESWLGDWPAPPAPQRRPVDRLTRRERQILTLVTEGRSNAEIAAELGIAVATVKVHVASIMDKTGTRDRLELASRMQPLHNEYPA